MDTQRKTARVLLIDDEQNTRETRRDFLACEGYDVVTAASGEEGLERLAAGDPDLIVLDMQMPGMGGQGFLQRISEGGRPRLPVLVLTVVFHSFELLVPLPRMVPAT